jgi:hypothetical protein
VSSAVPMAGRPMKTRHAAGSAPPPHGSYLGADVRASPLRLPPIRAAACRSCGPDVADPGRLLGVADRHSGILVGVAGVAVVAGGVLISIAAAEVSNTARSLSSNGWFNPGLALVILGVVLAVIGSVLHFRREVERPPAPQLIDAPPPAPPPAAPIAAAQSAVPVVNPEEFKPYHQESGEFPDGKALTFGFDHINDHPDAYLRLNPRRCTVITPPGLEVSATRTNRYFQYPQDFENAPPVRPGLYRFRLEGQLTNGKWEYITSGEHEVAPPLKTGLEGRQVRGSVWQSAKASGGSTVIQVGGDATMGELPLVPSRRTGARAGAGARS